MTTLSSTRKHTGRRRWHGLTIIAALVAALSATNAPAQAPAAPVGAATAPAATQLETLVSRIALYPDDLVSIILPAATNPLQIVQADRFLDKRKSDPKAPVDEKWDDAVKSLLNYPEVVKSMSADLDWTSDLGEAVVADQGAVLEAIQSFRRKTQSAGNLKSDQKQTVVVEKEVIKIVPADPQVIYVPQYNPTTVVVSGGYSAWGYYPSPYPVYYYPYAPGAAFATGLIWGAAITAAWNGGHYNTNWGGGGNNNININRNTNVQGGNRTTNVGAGGGSQWKSNKQPGQVSGSVGRQPSGGRVGDARPSGGGRDMGGGRDGGGARPSTQPAGGRDMGGGRDGGGGAFGGAGGSGRDAHMDSSRGASSRDAMGGGRSGASAGSRQAPSGGGGARASGGGGGGARAGGGGGGGGGGRGGGGGGRR